MDKHLLPRNPAACCLGVLVAALALSLPAQAQQTCQCEAEEAFGSCIIDSTAYPDSYPGSALVVTQDTDTYLYVVDLFNGFTYRYDADRFSTPGQDNPLKFPSPLGSTTTTGITAKRVTVGESSVLQLFWAIDNSLYRSDLEGNNIFTTGIVQLEALAAFLREETGDDGLAAGRLGGITYHPTRGTFWGVDIINDVYFEFDAVGDLVRTEGKPNYFFNPRRHQASGAAFGNTITYVADASGEYFDIPVGWLDDQRPSEVLRVHAVDGTAPETFHVGDETGISYVLGDDLGSPNFVTGIAFWPDSCGEGNHSEFILDLDDIGGTPKILQISADTPTAANVADLRCEITQPSTVALSWSKTLPYTKLTITRLSLTDEGIPPVTVYENTDFDADPGQFTDTNVPDGSYQYTASVEAAQPVADVDCRLAVGNGQLEAYRAFTLEDSSEPTPAGVTIADAGEEGGRKVIVADFDTGEAQTYDLDLNPLGTIQGPFSVGKTTGVAYGEFELEGGAVEKRLYWLQNLNGRFFLQPTDLDGKRLEAAVWVRPPSNLESGIALGDLTYDPERKAFWTVDLLNEVVYAVLPDGTVDEAFQSAQPPTPYQGGFLSGGIALAGSSEGRVTLDIPAGPESAGFARQITRSEYNASDVAATPLMFGRIDVPAAMGAADVAGLDIATTGDDTFEYVAARDTQAVYKIRITLSAIGGTFYRRGDANNDNKVDISDPSFLLENLFRGGAAPVCEVAADADGSETIDISDAIYLFNYLFKGGPPPVPPFPSCGIDSNTTLPCEEAFCSG